jgi:pimeloyl-ACP methyl ester carboxylesterase
VGERDLDVPLTVATIAADLIKGPTTLRELPGIGHLIPLEAPGELVDVVVKDLGQ